MWQRVQTLYLFISTALIVSLLFCNKAGDIRFIAYIPYLILIVIIGLLDLLALTTWKFRIFQFRTVLLSTLLTIAFQVWLAVDFVVTGNNPVFHVPAVFPVVTVIFNILAARNIWADELMVRSSSHLRAAKRKH